MGDLPLCQVLLLPDTRYPWFILVPRREHITEIYQLNQDDQDRLIRESSEFGAAIMTAYQGNKLNIGALGNMVPQLHIHHIVRMTDDAAWPGAVWGVGEAVPATEAEISAVQHVLMDMALTGFQPAA